MWLYEGEEFDSELVGEYYGFVYIIENKLDGRKYIGRKYFTQSATRQVKKKKRKYRKESNWREYWGSSPALLKDIDELGQENFTRTILRLCRTRGETNYWEVKYQFENDVLVSEGYYNSNIMTKFTRKNIGEI